MAAELQESGSCAVRFSSSSSPAKVLGSRGIYARRPTTAVPPQAIVADVNVDMIMPIVPLKLLTVLGLEDSDAGTRAREIAQSEGVKVQLTLNLCMSFVRSDQPNNFIPPRWHKRR